MVNFGSLLQNLPVVLDKRQAIVSDVIRTTAAAVTPPDVTPTPAVYTTEAIALSAISTDWALATPSTIYTTIPTTMVVSTDIMPIISSPTPSSFTAAVSVSVIPTVTPPPQSRASTSNDQNNGHLTPGLTGGLVITAMILTGVILAAMWLYVRRQKKKKIERQRRKSRRSGKFFSPISNHTSH